MALPHSELRTALFTAYRTDTTLRDLLVGSSAPEWGIFDAVPTNEVFPYVAIQKVTSATGTLLTMPYGKANDLTVWLDIFSQYAGFKEAELIASRIDTLTNEVSQSMTDFSNPMTLINDTNEVVEPDGITRRLMVRYKFYTTG